jgi:trk system potassium uptake protein TrkH
MEEVRAYFIIVIVATLVIALDIMKLYDNFGQALRYSFFQVNTIISTTGYSTADFNAWPTFAKIILFMLMIIGSCAVLSGCGGKQSAKEKYGMDYYDRADGKRIWYYTK